MIPEIQIAPRTVSNYAAVLKPAFKKDLDSYLKNRTPVTFLSEVRGHLQLANGESPGNRYNIQLINALVMYVGTSAIQYLRTKGLTPTMSAIGKYQLIEFLIKSEKMINLTLIFNVKSNFDTYILREINFGKIWVSKAAILTAYEILDFEFW